MRLKQVNDEVFYADGDKVKLNRRDIGGLIEKAGTSQRKRARICMHPDIDHPLHEMIIVHHRGVYVRPHYHINKTESFHILQGDADIVLFNDDGQVSDVVPVGSYGSDKIFYCRLPEKCYHSIIVYSDIFIVHEITGGPFLKDRAYFPEWAPADEDEKNVDIFFRQLLNSVSLFKK